MAIIQLKCRNEAIRIYGNAIGDNTHRFRLEPHDASSIYRTHATSLGITQRSCPEENLDKWFRQKTPSPPHPWFTEACLYYHPPTFDTTVAALEGRFALIISTPSQREAAWRYGHQKQVLMDGTFGITSARVLLFILMAIDNHFHGVPIAYILFSAREETKATHADYNTNILTELLQRFKVGMGQNEAGEEFEIRVGITDNDIRERNALSTIWPNIHLLLCMFHVWQAWRNRLNRCVSCVPEGPDRKDIRKRLASFMMRVWVFWILAFLTLFLT